VTAAEVLPEIEKLSTALEERVTKVHQATALGEVREQHKNYFDALNKHPRMLVGAKLPSLNGEGDETITDEADAKSWQEAVKVLLVNEVQARATKAMESQQDFLQTLHASIELFQNNADLIPGRLASTSSWPTASPRWSSPTSSVSTASSRATRFLCNRSSTRSAHRLRRRGRRSLLHRRQLPPATGVAPPGTPASPADLPQAGIPSKPGSSQEGKDDFSTLFGTIGLPDLQI
jgi:hypothetical protein